MATAVSPPLLLPDANSSAETPGVDDLDRVADREPNASPHPEESETLAPEPPPFINSIAELKGLSDAIYSFHHRYDDLCNHLDSIKVAILRLMPHGSPRVAVSVAAGGSLPPYPSASEGKVVQQQPEGGAAKSELESLCKTMCSRGVRKYLTTHLSDLRKLREEVPQALKMAPDPPKLVLECLGKFFLQGSKAYTKNSPMIPAREASILMLECYLLMLGMVGNNEKENWALTIEKSLKDEADAAAQAWRKRLAIEGGLAKSNQIDARGLLLFVGCFGIPASFKKEDIKDLMVAANAREIVSALQNSNILMAKVPGIVEMMIKNKMEVDAVDIVYAFGLVQQFNPQAILTSFLRQNKESFKKLKKGFQLPAAANQNEANKRHLAALKSVAKCLGRHKIDPAEVLPGWQINEKIATLEKEVHEFNQKSGERTAQKRKVGEMETPKKPKFQETKRPRFPTHGPQQPKATGRIDVRRNMLNSGLPPNHVQPYSAAPSVVYGGPGAGLAPETLLPPGIGAGPSSNHGGVQFDAAGHIINRATHPYLWHGDSAINDRYASNQPSAMGHTVLYRQPQSLEGFVGAANPSSGGTGNRGSASDLYQFADAVGDKNELHLMNLPRSTGTVPTSIYMPPYLYQS